MWLSNTNSAICDARLCACRVVHGSAHDTVSSVGWSTLGIRSIPLFDVSYHFSCSHTFLCHCRYYQGYETACLLLGVLCVAAVLQGGTTNWLVGIFFIGVYLMIAAGFWYHEEEDLSD